MFLDELLVRQAQKCVFKVKNCYSGCIDVQWKISTNKCKCCFPNNKIRAHSLTLQK